MSRNRSCCLAAIAIASLAGCASKATPTPAHLALDRTQYLFDTVTGPPSQHDFEIINEGGTATQPLKTSLNGDVTNFVITADKCRGVALAPQKSCAITVALSSPVEGAFDAQLHVDDSITDGADAIMSGKVGAAILAITTQGTGTVGAGMTTPGTVFTVTNNGGATTGSLTVSASSGAVSNDTCSGVGLAGGDSCSFTAPAVTATLDQTSAIIVTGMTSGAPGGTASAQATYTVVPAGTLAVTSLDFGSADPYFSNGDITVTNPDVMPTGPLTLNIVGEGTPSVPNPFTTVYDPRADLCSGVSLEHGKSCTVRIFMSVNVAKSGGIYSGTITVSGPYIHPATGTLGITTINNHGGVDLSVAGTGTGGIYFPGAATPACATGNVSGCGGVFVENGTSQSFLAMPAAGSTFAGWSGPCTGTATMCTVNMSNNSDLKLQATFN
jgi:hypothetical protein